MSKSGEYSDQEWVNKGCPQEEDIGEYLALGYRRFLEQAIIHFVQRVKTHGGVIGSVAMCPTENWSYAVEQGLGFFAMTVDYEGRQYLVKAEVTTDFPKPIPKTAITIEEKTDGNLEFLNNLATATIFSVVLEKMMYVTRGNIISPNWR